MVNSENALLLPPHIRSMKPFVKVLLKVGTCFMRLCQKLPDFFEAKWKKGAFTGPGIRI